MLPYYVMYLVFAAAALAVFAKKKSSDPFGADRWSEISNWICFSCVLILLMFRHETMGIDLNNEYGYLPFFDYAARKDFITVITNPYWFEVGFKLYIKVIASIWNSHQFFLAVTALISLLPIAYLIHKKSRKPVLSWIIYVSLMPFLLLFSGLRQGVVIGLGAILYILAEDKRPIPYAIIAVIAVTMHSSAWLLLLIYPLVNLKIGMKARLWGLSFLLVLILLRKYIIDLICSVFPRYAYMFSNDSGGAYRYFAVLLGIYIICCYFSDGSKLQNSYLNLFFAACTFQMFGFYGSVASRAGFYFVISLCILLPDVIMNMSSRKLALLLEAGTAVCFVLFGLYSIYTTDWAMAYPYHWFWTSV